MVNLRVSKLVDQFAKGVQGQTDAIWQGDSETSNRMSKLYIDAFAELRDAGEDGIVALAGLFMHSRPDVRCMAAAYLLRRRHGEAVRVLRELSEGKGLVAFEASQALKRWEEGTWKLDPE